MYCPLLLFLKTSPTRSQTVPQDLIDCGNWAVSASWTVPADATSGVYIAKLVRADTGGASHIVFVVRDDASTSDFVYQTSDTTWQAYNSYGGNSLYVGSPAGRAYKVSYNRPFITRAGDTSYDWVFSAEYPMIRWLEANGYDVSYSTGMDTDRRGNLVRNHKIFLSSGHDEYWSGTQRANIESARERGSPSRLFQWQRSILEDALGELDRRLGNTLSNTRLLQGNARGRQDRSHFRRHGREHGGILDSAHPPTADGPENALTGTLFVRQWEPDGFHVGSRILWCSPILAEHQRRNAGLKSSRDVRAGHARLRVGFSVPTTASNRRG